MERDFLSARLLALLVPALLLAGAWGSQLIGHLVPCEMCHWQRWPHYAALVLAVLAFLVPGRSEKRVLVVLAAIAIFVSGLIGVFHAGVEYHWWQGFTTCTSNITHKAGGDFLKEMMAAPIIRCDVAQWTLFGVSLAGFNAIFSILGAGMIAVLLRRSARA